MYMKKHIKLLLQWSIFLYYYCYITTDTEASLYVGSYHHEKTGAKRLKMWKLRNVYGGREEKYSN